jgi:hypothetical protein
VAGAEWVALKSGDSAEALAAGLAAEGEASEA